MLVFANTSQSLEAHIKDCTAMQRVLILRLILGYEGEPQYHYEIGVHHHLLSFGLEHGLADAIAQLAVLESGPDLNGDLPQIALEGAACWVHVLLMLTSQWSSLIR